MGHQQKKNPAPQSETGTGETNLADQSQSELAERSSTEVPAAEAAPASPATTAAANGGIKRKATPMKKPATGKKSVAKKSAARSSSATPAPPPAIHRPAPTQNRTSAALPQGSVIMHPLIFQTSINPLESLQANRTRMLRDFDRQLNGMYSVLPGRVNGGLVKS